LTENTITTEEGLFAELSEVRERGFSLNIEEEVKGINAVGIPVLSETDDALGAVSVSGPTARMQHERLTGELLNIVQDGVNVIEIEINRRWETMREITE
jgi:IclR family acetate operon transcriptional repressor